MPIQLDHQLFEGTKNLGVARSASFEFEIHQCGVCGVIWGLEDTFMDGRRDDHKGWDCPNGHGFVFKGESERDRLRREVAEERRRVQATRDLLHSEERSHAATRGHLTRTKKRVAQGVCPCCNRTFQQLLRHMANKHPDYIEEAAKS
jgi:hypothetical protein